MKFYEGILARANERSWLAFRPLSPISWISADGVAKPIVASNAAAERIVEGDCALAAVVSQQQQ